MLQASRSLQPISLYPLPVDQASVGMQERGFIADALPDDTHDWECIVDFCGRDVNGPANYSADWSPSLRETWFCGQWAEVPPLAGNRPTEEQIYAHVYASDTIYARRWAAEERKRNAWRESMDEISRWYEKHGYNHAAIDFALPDGSRRLVSQNVGRRGIFDVLRAAVEHMAKNMPSGTKVARLEFKTGVDEKGRTRKPTKRSAEASVELCTA